MSGNQEYYSANWIKVISPVLDNDGKLKSDFKVTDITAFDSKAKTIGLAAGDFIGDGILLRNPYHFYFEGRNVFTSVIQALPYHVDYIPLPWEKDGKPKLANLTYVPGGEVTYVRTKILTEAVEYLLEPGEYKKEVEITMSKEKEKNVPAEYTCRQVLIFSTCSGITV